MKSLTPFANDSESQNIGGLTIENGTERVSVYGNVEFSRDKAGLKRAKDLKAVVDKLVEALETDKGLPAKATAKTEKPQQVKNPFR